MYLYVCKYVPLGILTLWQERSFSNIILEFLLNFSRRIFTYPAVDPTIAINPYIVDAKFGAMSCALCSLVITTAVWKASAIVINAIHVYG